MEIRTINYQKTFNLGNYQSERIGVEIVLEQGESANKAIDLAKQFVEECHLNNNQKVQALQHEEEPIELIKTQSPQTLIERTMSFIDACKNEGELKAFEFMSKTKPELKSYYDKKLKSFK
jgi:hypothetical protein